MAAKEAKHKKNDEESKNKSIIQWGGGGCLNR